MIARIALAVVCCAFVPRAALGVERNWDLEELRSAIRGSRERVAVYEREQRGLLETLEALDRSTGALRNAIDRVRKRAAGADETLQRVESERAELLDRTRETQRAMATRAVALYKAGELGPVAMLFSAQSIPDLLARVDTLQRLLDYDADLIERHRVATAALGAVEVRARAALETRDSALADLQQRSAQLERERATKRRLVSRLGRDRTRERTALVELETAARALEETFSSLEAARDVVADFSGVPFASLRRRLPHPVAAPVVKRFGTVVDAEFHTRTFHKGVEFDAALGTPVRSVAPGQVRFAGWFRGYGKLVIVDHGDQYFTVLGHLDEIQVEVGDNIRAEQVVGTVGETGSLVGARLYFEIRHGREPQDPADWLTPTASARG